MRKKKKCQEDVFLGDTDTIWLYLFASFQRKFRAQ